MKLNETWSKLQNQGKVGSLTSFPYSVPFAQEVLRFDCCSGLVTYLNLLELEMIPLLEQMELEGQGYIAIRPLCGGLITSENAQNAENKTDESSQLQAIIKTLNIPITDVTKFAVQFPLLHSNVASVMVSVSNLKHVEEVIAAADTAKSDPARCVRRVLGRSRFLYEDSYKKADLVNLHTQKPPRGSPR
jgi:aryl-alcohol dehydrogenase-like predicted oxidoreductase